MPRFWTQYAVGNKKLIATLFLKIGCSNFGTASKCYPPWPWRCVPLCGWYLETALIQSEIKPWQKPLLSWDPSCCHKWHWKRQLIHTCVGTRQRLLLALTEEQIENLWMKYWSLADCSGKNWWDFRGLGVCWDLLLWAGCTPLFQPVLPLTFVWQLGQRPAVVAQESACS